MFDGTPYAMKVARTVWSRGKVGDYIKDSPIAIMKTFSLFIIAILIISFGNQLVNYNVLKYYPRTRKISDISFYFMILVFSSLVFFYWRYIKWMIILKVQ